MKPPKLYRVVWVDSGINEYYPWDDGSYYPDYIPVRVVIVNGQKRWQVLDSLPTDGLFQLGDLSYVWHHSNPDEKRAEEIYRHDPEMTRNRLTIQQAKDELAAWEDWDQVVHTTD